MINAVADKAGGEFNEVSTTLEHLEGAPLDVVYHAIRDDLRVDCGTARDFVIGLDSGVFYIPERRELGVGD